MASYNRTRYVEELLEKTESQPPSFTIHLHPEYWVLNNGSKFLYHNQIASLLDDIRAHRIPVDFLELFDSARVPFYDGCMVVELLDYRPQRSKEPTPDKPDRTRVILHPNSETLWADICSMNRRHGSKWTDVDALDVEAKLLLATSPPLCLDPNPHLTRIANHVLRVSTPTVPISLKRKAVVLEPEEDETERNRRAKIMAFMTPRLNRIHAPSYHLLEAVNNNRRVRTVQPPPTQIPGHQYMTSPPQPSPAPPTPASTAQHAHSPDDSPDKKLLKVKKRPETPQVPAAFVRANGSHTPIPSQPTHQFVNHHPPNAQPSPVPGANSPMQPKVYANVQAATEAAKRSATPSQQMPQQNVQHHTQLNLLQQQQQQHVIQQQQLVQQQLQHSQQQNPQQQTQQTTLPQQQQSHPQHLQQQRQMYTQSPKPPQAPGPQSYPQTAPQLHPSSIPNFPPSTFQFSPQLQVPRNTTNIAVAAQQQQQQPQSQPPPPTAQNANPQPQQGTFSRPYMTYQNHVAQNAVQMAQQQSDATQKRNQKVTQQQPQKNGRATPQLAAAVANHSQGKATPSPVRGSPMVANQQLAGRSPMVANQQLAGRSPMVTNQQLAGRSPMVTNQQLAPRSPMPPNAQQSPQQQQQHPQRQQQPTPQQQHLQQQLQFTPYNPPPHLRPGTAEGHSSPQLQAQIAAVASQARANANARATARATPSPALNAPAPTATSVAAAMASNADSQQRQHTNPLQQQQPSQQLKPEQPSQQQPPQQAQPQQQLHPQMHPAYQQAQQLYGYHQMNYQMAQAQGRIHPYWQPMPGGMGRGMPIQGMGGPVGTHPPHPHPQAASTQQVVGKQTAVPGGVPGR